MLLRDEAVAGHIREAVANTLAATADLAQATRKADALMTDVSSRQIPQKAGELVDHLRDSAQQIHRITSDISTPDERGMSAGANVRSSLTNVNAATVNLADVTEAAKHNFLVRGFFNERGYYSLADISPDAYRRDWGIYESLEPANLAVRAGAVPERIERGGTVRDGKGVPARRSHAGRRVPWRAPHHHRRLRERRRSRRSVPALPQPGDGGPAVRPGALRDRSKESRSRTDEEHPAERNWAGFMGRRVHRGLVGKLRKPPKTRV